MGGSFQFPEESKEGRPKSLEGQGRDYVEADTGISVQRSGKLVQRQKIVVG